MKPSEDDLFTFIFSKDKHLTIFKSFACILSPLAVDILQSGQSSFDVSPYLTHINSKCLNLIFLEFRNLFNGLSILVESSNYELLCYIFDVFKNKDFSRKFPVTPKYNLPFYLSLSTLQNIQPQFCEKGVKMTLFNQFEIPSGMFNVLFPNGIRHKLNPKYHDEVKSVLGFLNSILSGNIPLSFHRQDDILLSFGFNLRFLNEIKRHQTTRVPKVTIIQPSDAESNVSSSFQPPDLVSLVTNKQDADFPVSPTHSEADLSYELSSKITALKHEENLSEMQTCQNEIGELKKTIFILQSENEDLRYQLKSRNLVEGDKKTSHLELLNQIDELTSQNSFLLQSLQEKEIQYQQLTEELQKKDDEIYKLRSLHEQTGEKDQLLSFLIE